MKKILLIIISILVLGTISLEALAQEVTKEYVKVLFWAEDALGNRDSVWFIGTPTATEGIDEHLGEVNLYGVPPTKDLDLRIIQRTKVNYTTDDGISYWLIGPHSMGDMGHISPSNQDIDLKIDYRWQDWDTTGGSQWGPDPDSPWAGELFVVSGIVLEMKAIHYPVNIHAQRYIYSNYYDSVIEISHIFYDHILHNKEDGIAVGNLWDYHYDYDIRKLRTINSEDENFLLCFHYIGNMVGIKDSIYIISISPNPSSDYIFIDCAELESEEVSVFDVAGKFICSFIMSENPYMLDVSNFSNGLFFLINNDNHLLGKFIVEGK